MTLLLKSGPIFDEMAKQLRTLIIGKNGLFCKPSWKFGLPKVSIPRLTTLIPMPFSWPIDHFGTEHFGTDVSSREHFGTCTIWRCGRSSRWTSQHRNVSTWGIFGTGIFRHLAKQYVLLCRNVHVLKCPRVEIFLCRKVLVLKSPHVKMFPFWNVHLPERLQRRMVHVPKCSRDETSVPKWLLPKCSVPKWSILLQAYLYI